MLALLFLVASAFAGVKVVATTQDLASLAQAVGGTDVDVSFIARGDSDPHFVDAKPSYMVKLASADLVIAVGMELEIGWLPSLLTGARNPKIQPGTPGYLDASTGILAIDKPTGTVDRSRGDLHPQGNPHYWLDPEAGRSVARSIAARLSSLDAPHASAYQANLAAFESKLTEKEKAWNAAMAPLKGSAVVGYHSTFNYLCARYQLNVIGFVEPKPGIPPTPSHTLELAATAKEAGAKFVFVEPYHDARDAGPIATAAGAKVLVLPTSVGSLDGVDDYFGIFDKAVALMTGTTP
jgi:zinc/manganese transport system substrate-binding protein